MNHPALAEFTPDAYLHALEVLLAEAEPRAVLFGNTSIGADLASVLSARLNMPIVSSCQRIGASGELINQVCGGKIMAEVTLPDTATLISMIPGGYKLEEGWSDTPPAVINVPPPTFDPLRVTLSRYIEPEAGDVDITKADILIAIGRGIQNADNIELAEELAQAMGGEVCASRPLVDQGWLPTSRLVGKSGKSVNPKVYLALGISGAPEHLEGITDSETIIAINTDPAAPIFDAAQFGAEVDMLELMELLVERMQTAQPA
jgi:electron transfer flavoprotein alpha subunit